MPPEDGPAFTDAILAVVDDPDRARGALEAIRDSARSTLDELRTLLDVLRVDPGAGAGAGVGEAAVGPGPTPSLSDLPALVDRTRAAGVSCSASSHSRASTALRPGQPPLRRLRLARTHPPCDAFPKGNATGR